MSLATRLPALAVLLAALLAASAASGAPAACRDDPLQGRALYWRGSVNGWTADERQRLRWACDRWSGVFALAGEQRFKIGDEAWSADANFGEGTAPDRLAAQGRDLLRQLPAATYRVSLQPQAQGGPQLSLQACPEAPRPWDRQPPRLRVDGDAATPRSFLLQCDAFYLNLRSERPQTVQATDAQGQPLPGLAPLAVPAGEHTLRLARGEQGRWHLQAGPLNFADPREPSVRDPVAAGLRYDSRDVAHRSPFGAVPAGSTLRFAVGAPPGVESLTLVVERRVLEGNQERLHYEPLARVAMVREPAADGGERFVAQHRFDAVGVHGHWFEAQIGGQRYALHNNADAVAWTREKGSGGLATVDPLPADPARVRRMRISVHQPGFAVPSWAADAIWYQVFPERFRNGDASNDPQPGHQRYQRHGIERHARWLELPYKPGSGDGSDGVYNNDFFGGDLAGLTDKLPHLQRLGVTTIYSTPLFKAASNHKYDHADYRQIDPGFGRNADFERLTREAARRGMRIVPDASFNHTGSDSVYFDRYGNHGGADSPGAFANGRPNPASPWARWYRFDLAQTEPDKQYQGWLNVPDLPEVDKADAGWRDFAFRAPDSITRLWLGRGAAGWRMDVAPYVADDFWREWRAVVKASNPEAITVAETWFEPAKHLLGDMFDASMNYVFRNAVLDWARGGSAREMTAQLELLREQLPAPALHAMLNLLSSHDVPRALTVLGDEGPATPAAQRALARQRFVLATRLQMAWPGAPMVYYGDEVGMTGGDDPYNRGPYPWADQGGAPDTALEDELRRLIALRRAHPVLSRGTLLAPLWVDDEVLVVARRLDDGQAAGPRWAITAFSNADGPRRLRVRLPEGAPASGWRDLLAPAAPAAPRSAAQGELPIELPARGAAWLLP
ncbi:MAG: glycoside hydrolase family 13 protein [Burkholderiaceae bacterium]|nr:glycoside hydrolase family 13 protein [Burkholderiaceae bacterium]